MDVQSKTGPNHGALPLERGCRGTVRSIGGLLVGYALHKYGHNKFSPSPPLTAPTQCLIQHDHLDEKINYFSIHFS